MCLKVGFGTCYQPTTSTKVKTMNELYHGKVDLPSNSPNQNYNIWVRTSKENLDVGCCNYYYCCYCSQKKYNLDYQLARKHLGRFGLISHAHTIKTKDLSGIRPSLFAWKRFTILRNSRRKAFLGNVHASSLCVTAWINCCRTYPYGQLPWKDNFS